MNIVRTSIQGTRRPQEVIDQEREEIKTDILKEGKDYIEYTASYGSRNPLGQRIQEQCYVIIKID